MTGVGGGIFNACTLSFPVAQLKDNGNRIYSDCEGKLDHATKWVNDVDELRPVIPNFNSYLYNVCVGDIRAPILEQLKLIVVNLAIPCQLHL